MFADSPVHTDEYYADASSRRSPRGTALDTIIPRRRGRGARPERAADVDARACAPPPADVPLEMHFHNTTGLATLNYITGVEAGVTIVHTGVSAAGQRAVHAVDRGRRVDNLRRLGHEVDGRRRAAWPRSPSTSAPWRPSRGLRDAAPRPSTGRPAIQQQLPGGMTGTLHEQLRSYGMEDRLPEVLEEAIRGPRGDGLADHGHAVLAARRHPGAAQRRQRRAVRVDPGREPRCTSPAGTGSPPGRGRPGGARPRRSPARAASRFRRRPRHRSRPWRRSAPSTARALATRSCCCATYARDGRRRDVRRRTGPHRPVGDRLPRGSARPGHDLHEQTRPATSGTCRARSTSSSPADPPTPARPAVRPRSGRWRSVP